MDVLAGVPVWIAMRRGLPSGQSVVRGMRRMKRPRLTFKRFEDLRAVEPGSSPFVLEADGLRSLHFDYLSIQSQMRIANPVELVLGYTRTMMGFLFFTPEPRRIGMIGLGGGSIAKYCHEYLPGADITVVEINPDVIALRREFAVPPDSSRFRIVCGDGADFLCNHADTFDVLIVDGFDLEGQAAQLGSQAFYDNCHARLAEGGTLVVNLWGCDEKRGVYARRIREAFADRKLSVEAEEPGNQIVFATRSMAFPPPQRALRDQATRLERLHPMSYRPTAQRIINRLREIAVERAR